MIDVDAALLVHRFPELFSGLLKDKEAMTQQEIYWRQYQLNIETYRGYLELVLKINGLYYAITGAIVSYYFGHAAEKLMQLSLILPLIMSIALAVFFILGVFAAGVTRRETFDLRDKLGLDATAEMAVLIVLLCISAGLMIFVACGLGWLLWHGQ